MKWTKAKIPNDVEIDWFPDADWSLMDKHYTWQVISTIHSFLRWTQFVVACDDGEIRKICIDECSILQDNQQD